MSEQPQMTTRSAFIIDLVKAQSEMTAVVKGNVNPAFKSKYADLASVIDAVLPALNKHGIALIQYPSFDGEVVTVETLLLHTTGESLASKLSMRPSKQDPQGVGSAITYARRYALLAMCGVAPEDDDGQAASGPVQPTQRFAAYEAAPLADNGIKRLSSAQAKERGLDKEISDAIAGCTTQDELTDWNAEFGRHTAQCPVAWLDAIKNKVILRREEITRETGELELDQQFAETVG
jgi:hypothetical protein